jgi:hypothetical protein
VKLGGGVDTLKNETLTANKLGGAETAFQAADRAPVIAAIRAEE